MKSTSAFLSFVSILLVLSACTIYLSPQQGPSITATQVISNTSQPEFQAKTTPIPVPLTSPTPEPTEPQPPHRVFDDFIALVKNGNKDKIVGIYAENKLALQVVYQPTGNPGFVSTINGVVTYFILPYQLAKNHGFLAHNFLSGALFFDLKPGDVVEVVWGDGSYDDFEVAQVKQFQALSPTSPNSDFLDLGTGQRINANTLFIDIYKGNFHIAMQTCIAQGNEGSWGRYFVIAPPA